MNISFANLQQCIIPIFNFELKWRFTNDKYDRLPFRDLNQLTPLNREGAYFLWKYYMIDTVLHKDFPFRRNFFSVIDHKDLGSDNPKEIHNWLFKKSISASNPVFLSWEPNLAMITPWSIFVKYFDCFFYPGSDDLTVLDESLSWALLCHHAEFLYFGRK